MMFIENIKSLNIGREKKHELKRIYPDLLAWGWKTHNSLDKALLHCGIVIRFKQ